MPLIRIPLLRLLVGAGCAVAAWAQPSPVLDGLSDRPSMDIYSYAKKQSGSGNGAAGHCLTSAKTLPKSGNSVVDTRCSLVAFEMCMHQAMGTISQSQDSRKQCAIMQDLAGPDACKQPCAAAARLPVGGDGVIVTPGGTYAGLTPFAVTCYKETLGKSGGGTPGVCVQNSALQCLMNGSASAEVNTAIRRERISACAALQRDSANVQCSACIDGMPRVDYAPGKIDIDAKHCTADMAAKKLCSTTRISEELPKIP